ncbi:biotin-dependent carboxylase-like uncharacterized protein [Winogradskyella wandonensis]|uniref:Biotin-dependent carboxylase-like uncharacterized protein n=1 Tax=Winogradskyella wandonensis TaxID=1442586 RepID=A0A4R1KXJ8_9FLAO|nr:biotin-dependent carboxyltransferase family protein [Winogradskyella wandonensis]TCK69009.1 biotin-dependent carboxylase-like uncharacterized protein [Winogradskyella wandonensis]
MIKVLKAGISSSIQDLGRTSFREFGVPVAGSMDLYSSKLANALLGNADSDAVLEMALIGTKLQFLVPTQIAITGANMSPTLNGQAIANNQLYAIESEDILTFSASKNGLHTYLAVKGGFNTDVLLGSRSYYSGITPQSVIKNGDVLKIYTFSTEGNFEKQYSKLKPFNFSSEVLNVFLGPEFSLLSTQQKDQLFNSSFKVSNLYNRMAYQLLPQIENDLPSILTGPVLPGTVQLTPSGGLIVLMRDCQTTGGYPRVLQLSESSINLLAQKKENDTVVFNFID